MAFVTGTWYCTSLFKDSFELSVCDDDALTLTQVLKGTPQLTRLEPSGDGEWEAANLLRLRYNGKALFMRKHIMDGKWCCEVQVFRTGHLATKSFLSDKIGSLTWETVLGMGRRGGPRKYQAKYHECEMCLTSQIDYMLHPCGHTALCQRCVCQMLSKNNCVLCPCCCEAVEEVTKILEFVDAKPGMAGVHKSPEAMPISMLKNPRITWLKKRAAGCCNSGKRVRR